MIVQATQPLFAWDELQSSPTLGTIRAALEAIPDAPRLAALQARRHNGCDKYPVRVLGGVLLLAILLRHATTEAGLEELRRNAPLRRVFDHMVQRLGVAVPDLGQHTAGDSTGLRGRRDPNATRRAEEMADELPQASGGRKEYTDDDGKVTKIVEWFGYKLHLLVDVKHEVTLAYDITDTTTGDNERIEALTVRVDQAIDLRRFPSIPRATPQFERLYKGRTAVERVNDRMKVLWSLDDGNVVGSRRFCAHVSAVLLVHLACATLLAKAQRRAGSFGKLRRSPIAKKLEDLTATEKTATLT